MLRSPVRGLVRVSRYRHVGVTINGGALSKPTVLAPSAACAVVISALPPSIDIPADLHSPFLSTKYIVFEHVATEDASACLAGLWWLQLLRFAELEKIAQLKKAIQISTAWAIAVYLALATVKPPGTDAFCGLADATREKLLRATSLPDLPALRVAVVHILAVPERRTAFAEFLRTTLAPLACGVGWAEIKDSAGAPRYPGIPSEPGARTDANRRAHALLEAAQQATDIWVGIYAGAPVGQPVTCYRGSPEAASVSDIVRNGFSVFDLEAMVLSGHVTAAFSSIPPPTAPASPDQPVLLTAYDGEASGKFAVLRLADAGPGSLAYTMRDWLKQLVSGWHRTIVVDAPLDFLDMQINGHPLAAALNYGRNLRARGLRGSLDAVNAEQQENTRFDLASTRWWSNAVGFSTGINWPLLLPGGSPGVQDASREARNAPPTRTGETVGGTSTSSGFDEEDLELVLEAREHLRSGHDTTQMVDLPLVLALLNREGYRMNGRFMRQGPFDFHFRDNLNEFVSTDFDSSSLGRRGAAQGIGRVFYTLQVFGLDVLDAPYCPSTGIVGVSNWLYFAWNNLCRIITNATTAGTVCDLDTIGLVGRMLTRLASRFDNVTDIGQSRRLSRRVHLAGIIAQHGEFQRRHALLRQGSASGPLSNWWLPLQGGVVLPDVEQFTALAAPSPGANAEDVARRDYLAYYALCYLAFNGSPGIWKSWIDRAVALGAGDVPRFLLYDINDSQSAGGGRELWHRGHFVRFVVALDAYLRMSESGMGDVVFPVREGWAV